MPRTPNFLIIPDDLKEEYRRASFDRNGDSRTIMRLIERCGAAEAKVKELDREIQILRSEDAGYW